MTDLSSSPTDEPTDESKWETTSQDTTNSIIINERECDS